MKDKMPTGVEINGKQLRISFMLNGQRCREPLPGIVKINKASIAYADNKRRAIVAEIKEGRFDYAAHFPDSPRAARQLGHSDTSMVKKHYGRWIPTDTKSMAALVSQMMGFRDSESGL